MSENNRRYTDKGESVDPAKDILGALVRKLTEEAKGEVFTPRNTDGKGFAGQLEEVSQKFALKAKAVFTELETERETQAKQGSNEKGSIIFLSKSPHSPEHKKYLEDTVGKTLPGLRKAFDNDRIAIPTDNEILDQMIMTNRFRPEQIEALIRNIEVEGLIILPPQMQKFTDYEKFLNANKKRNRQGDVSVSSSRKQAFAFQDERFQRENNSALYKFGIGETAQELDNKSGNLRNIITKWTQSELAKVLRVPTAREYAVLDGQASDLLDLNGWSILCEEDKPHNVIGNDGLVSGGFGCGSWVGACRVYFDDSSPEGGCAYARVRPVVVE